MLTLFVSLFCALGSALFAAARVVHHVVLATVLAPVLALLFLRNGARLAVALPLATMVHALTFWAWHLPSLYAAALSHDGLFWLMQFTITGTGVILWTALLRAPASAAVAALLATMVQMGALGALPMFAQRALVRPARGRRPRHGGSPRSRTSNWPGW